MISPGCICGAHMLEAANEGTCLKCGHGVAENVLEHAYHILQAAPPMDVRVAPVVVGRKQQWLEDDCIAAYRRWEREHGRPPSSCDWLHANGGGHPTYKTVRRIFGGWAAFKTQVASVPRDQVPA